MKYAIKLVYDNGQGAYLSVKGRSSWKTKAAAKKHYDVCMQLLAKGRFLKGVVAVELERDFFA
jgi:hypothetical protein